jgi:UDP-glucose 4-epimerase
LEARNEVAHAFADHTKARSVFDPPPPVSLGEGLRRMAAWVLAQGPATPVTFDNIEVTEKLPPSWRSIQSPAPAGVA